MVCSSLLEPNRKPTLGCVGWEIPPSLRLNRIRLKRLPEVSHRRRSRHAAIHATEATGDLGDTDHTDLNLMATRRSVKSQVPFDLIAKSDC